MDALRANVLPEGRTALVLIDVQEGLFKVQAGLLT